MEVSELICIRSIFKIRRATKIEDIYKEKGITPMHEVLKITQESYRDKMKNSHY
jgi:hypothetical protein